MTTRITGSITDPVGTGQNIDLRIIPLDSRGTMLYHLGQTFSLVSGSYGLDLKQGYYYFSYATETDNWVSLGKATVSGSGPISIQDILGVENLDSTTLITLNALSDVEAPLPSVGDTLIYAAGGTWENFPLQKSITSGSAVFAETASIATSASHADLADAAGTATTASYSVTASYSLTGVPSAHAASHTDGTDDIQNATNLQKGLATAAHITTLNRLETQSINLITASGSYTLDDLAWYKNNVFLGTGPFTLTVENDATAPDTVGRDYLVYIGSNNFSLVQGSGVSLLPGGLAAGEYSGAWFTIKSWGDGNSTWAVMHNWTKDSEIDEAYSNINPRVSGAEIADPFSYTSVRTYSPKDVATIGNNYISALGTYILTSQTSSMSVLSASHAITADTLLGAVVSSSYSLTASVALNVGDSVSSSYAVTASFALNAGDPLSSSYASTASFVEDNATITYVDGEITTLSGSLATDIATKTTEAYVDGEITTLSSSLATDIATKTTEAYVDGEITTLSSSVATDIATNASDISSTSASLASDKADVTYVDSEITNLSSSVATDIATNVSDISSNTSLIDSVSASLASDKAAVSYVDTEVFNLSSSVASDINDLETNKATISYVDSQDQSFSASLATDIAVNTAKRSYPIADEAKLGGIEVSASADQSGSEVPLASVNGAAYDTVQKMQDVYHSSGLVTGGEITDAGLGTIDVAAGEGYIRSLDDRLDTLYAMAFSSTASLALTDSSLNYIYVFYNGGTPQIQASTSVLNTNNYMLLGTVFREGTTLHITETNAYFVGDHAVQMIKRLQNTAAFARQSGGVISETGTRNIGITAGVWWEGLNQFTTNAVDTSVADTFTYYYRDGGSGFTAVSSQTQINNTQYDDGTGTLATLNNNQYGTHWVYLGTDGDVYIVYGRGSYTLTDAEATNPPSTTPSFFTKHARLIGRIIILKSASTFTEIASVFDTTFSSTVASNHNELGGIQGGTTDEYYHFTAKEHSDLQSISASYNEFTSSYAVTASYALTGEPQASASYATTASYALNAAATVDTSSLVKVIQHGADANYPRPTGMDALYWIGSVEPLSASQSDIWHDTTLSSSLVESASYSQTSSYALYALTSADQVTSSYSVTASYALSSPDQVSASFATTASFALTSPDQVTASYASTASYTIPFAFVEHGATAATLRPSSSIVYWVGTVSPTYAENADLWFSGSI